MFQGEVHAMETSATIRGYRPGDEDAAYYVCLKTGNHGRDGEPYYREDPGALGRIYVGPYLEYEPGLALMLEDEAGVCGYALGALDSRAFYDRYERQWRPALCQQFPAPAGDPSAWNRVQSVYFSYHHPTYFYPESYASYPSHVHIDLLERARGRGHGRAMMETLLDRLRSRGSPGTHLGLSMVNENAYRFYLRLGFVELERVGEGENGSIYMGKQLA